MTEGDRYPYTRIFDPPEAVPPETVDLAVAGARVGDKSPAGGYSFRAERVVLAVNVALATGRPLLVSGEPGCGKSTLALAVAQRMDWDYFAFAVTSRSSARDLMWTFDALSRLRDAQVAAAAGDGPKSPRVRTMSTRGSYLPGPEAYVRPGPLWWALDPQGAAMLPGERPAPRRAPGAPGQKPGSGPRARAVLLIDEIDKADPDIPNDLLGALGTFTFEVTDAHDRMVTNTRPLPPLVIITTNNERDLPQAFLRRCVTLTLDFPTEDQLVEIGRLHYGTTHEDIYRRLAKITHLERQNLSGKDRGPGTAEYLDTVEACLRLDIEPPDPDPLGPDGDPVSPTDLWQDVRRTTLVKWVQASATDDRW